MSLFSNKSRGKIGMSSSLTLADMTGLIASRAARLLVREQPKNMLLRLEMYVEGGRAASEAASGLDGWLIGFVANIVCSFNTHFSKFGQVHEFREVYSDGTNPQRWQTCQHARAHPNTHINQQHKAVEQIRFSKRICCHLVHWSAGTNPHKSNVVGFAPLTLRVSRRQQQ